MSYSLPPRGLQPTTLFCPPLSPRVCSNSIESVMLSKHLNFCHPLLLLPSIFPSIRVFSNESALCIRWPKDWSFSFSISPSNEYSGWFPLGLAGLLYKLLRVFSSTTVQKHRFFGIWPSSWSNSHIHTWLLGKPQLWLYRPLSIKWCSLLFNML